MHGLTIFRAIQAKNAELESFRSEMDSILNGIHKLQMEKKIVVS